MAAFSIGIDFKPSSIDVEMEESKLDITAPDSEFIGGNKSTWTSAENLETAQTRSSWLQQKALPKSNREEN